MKVLVVIGYDKISAQAYSKVKHLENMTFLVDRSTDWMRVLKLIRKGIVSLSQIFKMFFAEKLRPGSTHLLDQLPTVEANDNLIDIIKKENPQCIFLFRAGLVINKRVLKLGVPIFNIHSASLPDFKGLGAIARALSAKRYKQAASLHTVVAAIDAGKVWHEVPYELKPDLSYAKNEMIAYQAGTELLIEVLSKAQRGLSVSEIYPQL